jgi:hypothetical protein
MQILLNFVPSLSKAGEKKPGRRTHGFGWQPRGLRTAPAERNHYKQNFFGSLSNGVGGNIYTCIDQPGRRHNMERVRKPLVKDQIPKFV